MPSYTAPLDDMLFLFEKLRDNKNYNELEKYNEVNSDLVKDILEEAAKINQNLLLPLALAGDENPAKLENGVVRTPPGYKEAYNKYIEDGWISLSCDPRGTAKKAEEYLKSSGVGDKAFFGPEPEFFVFDDVRISNDPNNTGFVLDSKEGPYNSGKVYENGNMGHRPPVKGGYFPVPPVDSEQDMRGEYLKNLKEVGIKVEKHHHEVAPSQHELGMYFGTLVDQADNVQLYKYVVQMVTHSFGKTATFMPKPVAGDNGSGMHIHQSIWKGDTPVFSGDAYAGLSETALHYIGGILKHAKAINAFANSTTNSYKRLVPGFEAPVLLAYSARNRSASCRIPITLSKKGARCEIRFPDASGNPYLTFAAMLMAGLDGIKNKIHPGESFDKDLYELPPEEVKAIPTVCGSLREAMESLDKDREFLTQGGVFTDDQIDAYIALKFEEIHKFEHAPHPVEFEMYYSS
ncbi:type I glutamate--ammonia ligase [Candidatus Pelagibacter bacterium]|nr:type I glutamate--ammonia ligase [Candidatus Pelagibacter bacterium]